MKISQKQNLLEQQMQSSPWLDDSTTNIVHLSNINGMTASFMDIGATWLSCILPIGEEGREVLLRSSNMNEHLRQTAFFGSIVGRYANRIDKGQFSLNGKSYAIETNDGLNSLHGGHVGVDKKRWQIKAQTEQSVTFTLLSENGDQGFPGNMHVEVTYTLSDDNKVTMTYRANVDQDSPVNLTNHAYFNLAGEGSGKKSRDHYLQMAVESYLPTADDLIPTGELRSVKGTSFDFTAEKLVDQDFLKDNDQKIAGGYDHAFIFNAEVCDGSKTVATLTSPDKTVVMKVATTKPAVQFYSGNFLDDTPGATLLYQKYDGVALETQYFPDGPNHPEWGESAGILKAGEEYNHQTSYLFEF